MQFSALQSYVKVILFIAIVRPRASSVAERLWSDANATQDVDTARHRLDQMRCRMLRRGIPAAPILNGYCGDYEWDMNDNNMPVDLGDRVRLQ